MKVRRFTTNFWALGCAALVFGQACYGQFALTRKLYNWNGSVTQSKVGNSVIMVGLIIIPVYELATLGDAIIFNVAEFFSGKNPMAVNEDGSAQVKYAAHTYDYLPNGEWIEVSRDGRSVLRYRRQGDNQVVIQNGDQTALRTVPRPANQLASSGLVSTF